MASTRSTRIVVIGAICALVGAPGALAAGGSCPQAAGQGCEPVGAKQDGARSGAASQPRPPQVRIAPRAGLDYRGQQAWRAGNHLMQ